MGRQIPRPDSGADEISSFTDEDLEAIDAAVSSFTRSRCSLKRHTPLDSSFEDGDAQINCPPKTRRRLPESFFVSQKQQEVKFEGRIVYGRTVEDVEKAAVELLNFVQVKMSEGGMCVLGLDIEWRPSFRKGVPPGKAAVMQICGDNSCCYVLHIFHTRIPENLKLLLEDHTVVKVGACIAGDASKMKVDHNVTINNLRDLSDLANQKLSLEPRKWGLSALAETLISKVLPKPKRIRLGNWEAKSLSNDQLTYAATDAYISWYLHTILDNLEDPCGSQSADSAGET